MHTPKHRDVPRPPLVIAAVLLLLGFIFLLVGIREEMEAAKEIEHKH